jgi:cellulose synthase (UDP-forming)
MLFEDYQWLMVIAILGICFLMAIALRTILRKKARSRLQGNGGPRIET